MGLSPKERKFVAEYLKNPNGTQAAIRAGYAKGSADVTASRLLGKARVRGAIDAGLAKAEISSEYVLRGLKKIADSGEEHNRVKAFELLGKHKKLFTDKVEHSGTMTLEQIIMASGGKAP